MKIQLTAGTMILYPTLGSDVTARDFAPLLPLTLRTSDLLRRESTVAFLVRWPRAVRWE